MSNTIYLRKEIFDAVFQTSIDWILNDTKNPPTIERLMDDSKFKSEMRKNPKLQEFVTKNDNLKKIIEYAINPNEKYHEITYSLFNDENVVVRAISKSLGLIRFLLDKFYEDDEKRIKYISNILGACILVKDNEVLKMTQESKTSNDSSKYFDKMIEKIHIPGSLNFFFNLMTVEFMIDTNVSTLFEDHKFFDKLFEEFEKVGKKNDNEIKETLNSICDFMKQITEWKNKGNREVNDFIYECNRNDGIQILTEKLFDEHANGVFVEYYLIFLNEILKNSTIENYSNSKYIPNCYEYLVKNFDKFDSLFDRFSDNHNIILNLLEIINSLISSGFSQVYEGLSQQSVLNNLVKVLFGSTKVESLKRINEIVHNLFYTDEEHCEMKIKFLDEGRVLKLCLEKDKEAVECEKNNEPKPDYYSHNDEVMKEIYESVFGEDAYITLFDDMNKFETFAKVQEEFKNYVETIICPRISQRKSIQNQNE